jgi:hypothetical protein
MDELSQSMDRMPHSMDELRRSMDPTPHSMDELQRPLAPMPRSLDGLSRSLHPMRQSQKSSSPPWDDAQPQPLTRREAVLVSAIRLG